MINHSLVYIHAADSDDEFVGCGVLTEGEYVVTCRHVWQDAVAHRTEAAEDDPPTVTIVYPYCVSNGIAARGSAILVESFEIFADRSADIAILKPASVPDRTTFLRLAMEPRNETGPGYAIAGRRGLDPAQPHRVRDIRIAGEIADHLDTEWLRQFSGTGATRYWFAPGSSGSPVFIDRGEQLAGIVRLSEGDHGPDRRQEAFVIPATVIRAALELAVARSEAERQHIPVAELRPVLDAIGARDVSVAEIPARLRQFVETSRAHGDAAPPGPSNDGDIAAAVGASRDLVQNLEPGKALALLSARLAEEDETRRRRRIPLLKEQAAVQRIVFDHEGALATLREIVDLDPSDVWTWIAIGQVCTLTGSLEPAGDAYRRACAAAAADDRDMAAAQTFLGDVLRALGDREGALVAYRTSLGICETLVRRDPANTGWQRDLSVSHSKVGDVLVAQGDREGALAAYRAGLAIAETLAGRDPANTEWQRDLSISHDRIGDVLVAQGDGESALAAYRTSLGICETLAGRDPANAQWQRDLSVSHNRIGDVLVAQGDGEGALAAYRAGLAIAETLARRDPANAQWQRDLIVSCVKLSEAAPTEARSHLTRAVAIAAALRDSNLLAPVDHWIPDALAARLAALPDA